MLHADAWSYVNAHVLKLCYWRVKQSLGNMDSDGAWPAMIVALTCGSCCLVKVDVFIPAVTKCMPAKLSHVVHILHDSKVQLQALHDELYGIMSFCVCASTTQKVPNASTALPCCNVAYGGPTDWPDF